MRLKRKGWIQARRAGEGLRKAGEDRRVLQTLLVLLAQKRPTEPKTSRLRGVGGKAR